MFVSSCNTFCYKFHPGNRSAVARLCRIVCVARPSWFPVRVPFAPVRVRSSRLSLEVAVGDRGDRWDRSAVHRRASVHICAVSSAVPVLPFSAVLR